MAPFLNYYAMLLKHCIKVVDITTTQLHSTKPDLRFCAVSNPAQVVLEIGND